MTSHSCYPASTVPANYNNLKIRAGLTVTSIKILLKINRCFKCHKIRHTSNQCKEVNSGKALCGKCKVRDHNMENCINEPRCTMCSTHGLANKKHITGSLACPIYRRTMKEGNSGIKK